MQNIPNPAVILVVILNVLIFITYLILKNSGEKASLINGAFFRNPIKLYQLAKRTESIGKKISYFTLIFSMPIMLALFLYAAGTQIFKSTNRIKCEYQEYFKNREWNGIVVNRYLDEENHDFKTISVENDDRAYKIQGQILSEFNNYDLIQVGDSISKIKGELMVHLYKSTEEIELKLEFDCEK